MTAKTALRNLLFFWLLLCAVSVYAGEFKSFPTAKAAPPLALKKLSGNDYDLTDDLDKVILVNFWGSWCPSCIREMPSLQRLRDHYKGNDRFALVTVNVNQTRSSVERFINGLKLDLLVLMDSSAKAANSWNVNLYPSSFLLDKSGRLRYFAVGEVDWDDVRFRRTIDTLIRE